MEHRGLLVWNDAKVRPPPLDGPSVNADQIDPYVRSSSPS
jgi:hypothetical protein